LTRIFARSNQNRSGLFSATTLVVLAAVIGFVEWKRYATEHRPDANTVVMRELKTQRGQLMTMQFSDGTSVTLAPQTRLRISPAFGEGNRDVVLDGEAYFDVTSRTDAPFVIHTNQSVVHVLGTRFDVRAYGPSTTVGVVSGKVALTTNQAMSAGVIVTKDHVGTIDANGEAQVRWEDMAPYTGWVQGKLVFHDTPLPQVLERLGRWYGVRLSTDSEKLIRKSVYAEWQDKSLEDVLQLLSEALNARVVREGDQVTLFAR
jgi:ferric-dicitrate binding protein FerR (iron transport regulator)